MSTLFHDKKLENRYSAPLKDVTSSSSDSESEDSVDAPKTPEINKYAERNQESIPLNKLEYRTAHEQAKQATQQLPAKADLAETSESGSFDPWDATGALPPANVTAPQLGKKEASEKTEVALANQQDQVEVAQFSPSLLKISGDFSSQNFETGAHECATQTADHIPPPPIFPLVSVTKQPTTPDMPNIEPPLATSKYTENSTCFVPCAVAPVGINQSILKDSEAHTTFAVPSAHPVSDLDLAKTPIKSTSRYDYCSKTSLFTLYRKFRLVTPPSAKTTARVMCSPQREKPYTLEENDFLDSQAE